MTKPNSAPPDPKILEANGVRLNIRTHEAICDGVAADLGATEFDILEILMRSAGQVVTKDALGRALESKLVNAFAGSFDVQVNRLKRKLERGRGLIRVVGGYGYLFVAVDEHGPKDYRLA